MKRIKYPRPEDWPGLTQRPAIEQEQLEESVTSIISEVKNGGDTALLSLTQRLDNVKLKQLQIDPQTIKKAKKLLSPDLLNAISLAKENIERFHLSQLEDSKEVETTPGVFCWRKSIPISPIGIYIPGGSAPLFSTVLMLGVPAKISGCEEIILCTPPDSTGKINPAILATADILGIEKIFSVGGAQAIAAMAYGTESIPKVQKIFGPGNQYVTAAKTIVSREKTVIDLPAGPSELAIIADESCPAKYIAADLLSQAEHGTDSQVVLVSTSESLLNSVCEELDAQVKKLPRKETAKASLSNSKGILVSDLEEAVFFVNEYAPEHLIIATKNSDELALKVKNAGSVFLGNFSPEAVGDYASGTNHVLPTGGFAKVSGGVSLDSFFKKITFQKLSLEGLKNIAPAVCEMATAEKLEGHKEAVRIRLEDFENV